MNLWHTEKKASAKIDIPSVYDEVRRAYADMGYPVSGDRLVLSEQPTYVDGRPVPEDVLNPRSSGGNTQHDGTVRINPRYRAVMRHWKINGSGRDFLRLIIGHELGHHIDRSVLSKPERAEERKRLLKEIVKAKFHTGYTDSYGPDTDPRKLDKELLAEYLAKMVRHKLEKKASVGYREPFGPDELSGLQKKNNGGADIAYGTITEPILKDRQVTLSPAQARINTYHNAARAVHGDGYDRAAATQMAMADMEAAQRARFAALQANSAIPASAQLQPGVNYVVPGHSSVTNLASYSEYPVSIGSVTNGIPVYKDRKSARGYYRQDGKTSLPSSISVGSPYVMRHDLGLGADAVMQQMRDAFLHEGNHSVTPFYDPRSHSREGAATSYGGPATYESTEQYANVPSELLVGVLDQKAKMRMMGDDGSDGMGRRWAQMRLAARNGGAPIPENVKDKDEEYNLNVTSMEKLLLDLHEKATSEGATEEDKKKYNEYLDALDFYFKMARNGRGRTYKFAEKKAEAHHPDFEDIVERFRDRYGIDLSHMRMKWSKHPRYVNGERSYDFEDDETIGSHGGDGVVYINPNLRPVMRRFGIPGTVRDLRRWAIAHELAHELHAKYSDAYNPRFVQKMTDEARQRSFRTMYTDSVPEEKLGKELFAEYMAKLLTSPAEKGAPKGITFPAEEVEGLADRDSIVTHRVSDDFDRFAAGDKVTAPWGGEYTVADRQELSSAEESPYYNELTDRQKALLKTYDRIALLRLERAGAKPKTEGESLDTPAEGML